MCRTSRYDLYPHYALVEYRESISVRGARRKDTNNCSFTSGICDKLTCQRIPSLLPRRNQPRPLSRGHNNWCYMSTVTTFQVISPPHVLTLNLQPTRWLVLDHVPFHPLDLFRLFLLHHDRPPFAIANFLFLLLIVVFIALFALFLPDGLERDRG